MWNVILVVAAPAVGFTATAGGGVNVDTPFVEAQVGRRWKRAAFLETFLDYSYDRAISEFSFQTFGIGVRTYFLHFDRFEVFHQAMAAIAISSSGNVDNRDLGQRLLGAMLTQGAGIQAAIDRCRKWTVAVTVSTGTPVWLRPELAVRFTF